MVVIQIKYHARIEDKDILPLFIYKKTYLDTCITESYPNSIYQYI